MRRFLLIITVFSAFLPICLGNTIVYKMVCLENTFDTAEPCPTKNEALTSGFVALDVNLAEVAALECGDSVWTTNAEIVRFGHRGSDRWRCTEESLVRIFQLGDNELCVVIESDDEQTISKIIYAEDPNEPGEPNKPGEPNEPGDPNEPGEPNIPEPEPEGVFGKCFTCNMSGRDINDLIYIGGNTKAPLPWILHGNCIYNGDRIKGNSRCGLWLNLRWTRLANDQNYSPEEIINQIIDHRLSSYTPLGSCCNPGEPYPAD